MALYSAPEHHPAFEEYCETIFELHEDDINVLQVRIADRLGHSRPAVSEMIKKLESHGLIDTKNGRFITLTEEGKELAERVVRRHRLAERFLTDVLGLSWAQAHSEAGRWEHVISETVEKALTSYLGDPTTCPHGNPIPGADYNPPNMRPLGELEENSNFTIMRIPEELEFTPGMLEFLELHHIMPGTSGIVSKKNNENSITICVDNKDISLDIFVAQRLYVEPTAS